MPSALTTLDPRTALILIDLQKGIAGRVPPETLAPVLANAVALAEAFRAHHLPVVLVNVDAAAPGRTNQSLRVSDFPPDWTELLPALNPQPGDITVTKRSWGAFSSTDLIHQLRDRGVTQVVVGGIATSAGVESTARHAHELGFHVTAATDAMADAYTEAHANSLRYIFPRIGETGTTAEILTLLEQTRPARTPEAARS